MHKTLVSNDRTTWLTGKEHSYLSWWITLQHLSSNQMTLCWTLMVSRSKRYHQLYRSRGKKKNSNTSSTWCENAVGRWWWVTLAEVSGWYACYNRAVGLQKKALQWTRECAESMLRVSACSFKPSPVTDSRTKQSSDSCFTAAGKWLLFYCHKRSALHQSAAFLVSVSSVLLTLTKVQWQSFQTRHLFLDARWNRDIPLTLFYFSWCFHSFQSKSLSGQRRVGSKTSQHTV